MSVASIRGVSAMMAFLATFAAPVLAGEAVHATVYEIEARFIPSESFIEARASVTLRESGETADAASFWLHGELRVSEVTASGETLDFSQERVYYRWDYSLIGNHVTVSFTEGKVPDTIEVKWSGYFHPSRARSPSDYMRIDETGVLLRSLGYSPWFPIFLEPGEDEYDVDFRRVSVTVPSELTAVFAGTLESVDNLGEEARFKWNGGTQSLFAGQLTARPYVVTRVGSVNVYSLGDRASLSTATQIVALTRSLLDHYRTHYRRQAVAGPVHVVEMPKYGDISSGNVVGIQEERWRAFSESESARQTLAHELVHPFVRPPITGSDPLYAFAIESFPSYFHFAALDALGEMDYASRIARIRDGYLEKRKTGKGRRGRPLPAEKPISSIAPEEIGIYKDTYILSDRAILLLHELRARMGKERFDEFTRSLFAMERVDDQGFRGLVIEFLPDFGDQLSVWLDGLDMPDMTDL